jgi:hypothetical protein
MRPTPIQPIFCEFFDIPKHSPFNRRKAAAFTRSGLSAPEAA